MSNQTTPSDEQVSKWLKKRKRFRLLAIGLLALLIASVLLDHFGLFGYPGNDLRRFDHQTVAVKRMIDAGTIAVALPAEGSETIVHLLGIDAPRDGEHDSEDATRYVTERISGQDVRLRLEPIGWRNPAGELLAYVYIGESDNLNLDVIHEGHAYADRRVTHSFHSTFEAAESDARKKKRGLWKDFTDDQMPAWRRDWLRSQNF